METCCAYGTGHPLYVTLFDSLQPLTPHNNFSNIDRRFRLIAIGCYPYQDKDQFIVEECPHVYFVGNQPKYGSVEIQGMYSYILAANTREGHNAFSDNH